MRPTALLRASIAALAFAVLAAPAAAGQRVSASEEAPTFGRTLAASFDFFAVGVTERDSNRGGVYGFSWSGAEWEETQILVASDGAPFDFFGSALALDGDTLVVGATGVDGASLTNEGAAYVFRWNGATWVEEQKLLSPDAPDLEFGTSVAADGDRVVVGTLGAGVAYAFEWNGASWTHEQTIPDPGGSSNDFARTLAAHGDVLVAGARGEDDAGTNAGAVHVYRHDGAGYAFEQTLFAPDANTSDLFGHDVAVAGDRLLASALLDDEAGSNAGAAYLFAWNGSAWAFVQKLLPGAGSLTEAEAVALGSDFAVVGWALAPNGGGAPSGRVHVYRESAGVWSIDATLLPSVAGDNQFGADVAADQTLLVAGSAFGAAYAYDLGVCGNGRVGEDEACDDANGTSGDGCSPSCVVEECSNGTDDDGDGLSDYPADPGCRFAASLREQVACQDGIDNDARTGIDFDGGASLNGGVPLAAVDPQCDAKPWRDSEKSTGGCGVGVELAFALAGLAGLRRR